MRIPLSAPDISEADIQAVTNVLRTNRLSMGPALEEFEQSIAARMEASHVVAVNSGTSALHLCLRAFGVGPGDEVIVPSFSFIATANAIRHQDAIPVFVDIEPHSLNLDPAAIEEAITSRTRGIVVVHTFGFPAEMSPILQIARRYGLFVLEDACEAIGAEYYGSKCGTLGDAGVFAFYPNKQITTGEGGAIVTCNPAIARFARELRNQGRLESCGDLRYGHVGYNYRLSEMNCALGNAQIHRLKAILRRRETIAANYSDKLRCNQHLIAPPGSAPGRTVSWFVYVVRLAPHLDREDREWIITEMAARGIECGRYFAPIHHQPAYRREPCKAHALPITEWIDGRTLALPFFNRIAENDIQNVCDALDELTHRCAAGARQKVETADGHHNKIYVQCHPYSSRSNGS
ncbi:MAG: Bacillosamine/Legionaminic acid biosynthesis aminotransferase PglE [Candidatus Angelobacter sp.]|nr:Bacillosamine/Legionaminic acid biosynthesis aminotransferase PglE [Candidatus Angelobacter sp.]